MHPSGAQSGLSLTTAFQANLTWFTGLYGSNPSATTRTHQVEWQGWVDGAKVAANNGIGMDTSFYTWGPAITYPDGHQAHGYINGSGQPMRFVDQTGAIVPVYQQVTSLIDEALVTTDFLRASHAGRGDGGFAADHRQQPGGRLRGGDDPVPRRLFRVRRCEFLGHRDHELRPVAGDSDVDRGTLAQLHDQATHNGDHQCVLVAGGQATVLLVAVPAGSETQSLALPQHFDGFGLTSVTVDGARATGVQQQIAGRPTVFFGIAAGSHDVVASYNTPLPTASLSVAPTTITQGQTATLSWSTANATTVTIDQGIGVVGPSGTRTVNPLVTTTYNITATNSAGSVTTAATLTVIPPAPTVTASVSPTTIAAGDPATLSWSTTNAGTVTIDQGIGLVSATGTRIVSPPSTTTYTVTVTNATGTATSAATLTVTPAPAGASLRFNGTNQRARFTTLPAQTVFTVEGWVKRTADTGRWETFFSNVNGGYNAVSVNMYVDGGNNDCGSSPPDQFAWAYTRVGGRLVRPVQRRQREPECLAPYRRRRATARTPRASSSMACCAAP